MGKTIGPSIKPAFTSGGNDYSIDVAGTASSATGLCKSYAGATGRVNDDNSWHTSAHKRWGSVDKAEALKTISGVGGSIGNNFAPGIGSAASAGFNLIIDAVSAGCDRADTQKGKAGLLKALQVLGAAQSSVLSHNSAGAARSRYRKGLSAQGGGRAERVSWAILKAIEKRDKRLNRDIGVMSVVGNPFVKGYQASRGVGKFFTGNKGASRSIAAKILWEEAKTKGHDNVTKAARIAVTAILKNEAENLSGDKSALKQRIEEVGRDALFQAMSSKAG